MNLRTQKCQEYFLASQITMLSSTSPVLFWVKKKLKEYHHFSIILAEMVSILILSYESVSVEFCVSEIENNHKEPNRQTKCLIKDYSAFLAKNEKMLLTLVQ